MTNSSRDHGTNTNEGTADTPPRSGVRRATRWQKAVGIVGLLVLALVVSRLLGAGGEHGPSRHLPGGGEPAGQGPEGEGAHAPPNEGH